MGASEDYAMTVVPIRRSVVFWEASEVCLWLEALQFDSQASRITSRDRNNVIIILLMMDCTFSSI